VPDDVVVIGALVRDVVRPGVLSGDRELALSSIQDMLQTAEGRSALVRHVVTVAFAEGYAQGKTDA
jgi:hypothetical protein